MIKEVYPGIYKISFPYKGATNSYLIGEKNLTMVDTNWYFDSYLDFLKQDLAKIGRKPQDIKKVILTHFHGDHSGCALFFEGKAEICCHIEDKNSTENIHKKMEKEIELYKNNLDMWGFPLSVSNNIIANRFDIKSITKNIKINSTVKDNDILEIDGRKITVLHTPGHTSGSISLYLPSEKILFSGDTILDYFITFPELCYDASKIPLLLLLSSFEKIKELDPDIIFPGHGRKITETKNIIEKNINYYKDEIQFFKDKLTQKYWTFYELLTEGIKKNNWTSAIQSIVIASRKIQNYLVLFEKENLLQKEVKENLVLYKI